MELQKKILKKSQRSLNTIQVLALEVAEDLVVVGDNWWIERHEYDGNEWWEYKEKAKAN